MYGYEDDIGLRGSFCSYPRNEVFGAWESSVKMTVLNKEGPTHIIELIGASIDRGITFLGHRSAYMCGGLGFLSMW